MACWKDEKEAFLRAAVEQGFSEPGDVGKAGLSVPSFEMEKWLRKLLATPKQFAPQRRFVNRFRIGADPEFVFGNKQSYLDQATGQEVVVENRRMDAVSLGLKQGPAFGADNNGRLAEIRPYPSRGCVEVVASLLTTFRWMAALYPALVNYEWLAGAYLWDDGLGGHVHFGRKRPFREKEVAALDAAEEELLAMGVFPQDQVRLRRRGDARRQIYGALGDFRLQQHGYEYRTFPSWLDSPELAFLTLVVSKLAVYKPDLYRLNNDLSVGKRASRLWNFLSYFKNTDDDARLALVMLSRGLPIHKGGDFKGRWGIPKAGSKEWGAPCATIKIVPLAIKPDPTSKEEVFDYLLAARNLGWRIPTPTWGPVNPPSGYEMCIDLANTNLMKGLGELIWDLCCSSKWRVVCQGRGKGGPPITVSKGTYDTISAELKEKYNGVLYPNSELNQSMVGISQDYREGNNVRKTRELLTSGILPIWKVGNCKEGDFETWKSRLVVKKKEVKEEEENKLGGSMLWGSCMPPRRRREQ